MNEPEDGTLPQVASVTNHSGARRSWGDMAFNTECAEGLQISRVRRHLNMMDCDGNGVKQEDAMSG
jgi:hypothetical protein